MFDKEQVKAAMEGLSENDAEALALWDKSKCKAPFKVVYVIFTNCTTINNGACPDWDFCDPVIQFNKGR